MDRWPDFVISEATYGPGRQLWHVLRHKVTELGVSEGEVTDKMAVVSDIKGKITYMTAHMAAGDWKTDGRVQAFLLSGRPFVRIDGNVVEYDNLGLLPEVGRDGSQNEDGGQMPFQCASASLLAKLRKRHMQESESA